MTRYCWDFMSGQPRHFPAGTYEAQQERPFGMKELELMDILHRCWQIFSYRDLDEWDTVDEEFAAWVAREPKQETTLDDVIWQLLER